MKRYGVIFTCLTSRCIHIEKLDSLSTESLLMAMDRFMSRRGRPQKIMSDNGGNFVRANMVIAEEINAWNQRQVEEFLLQKGVAWKFNPPYASHFGGIWERHIRTIRKLLFHLLSSQSITDEVLCTVFCQVEWIINSTPLRSAVTSMKVMQKEKDLTQRMISEIVERRLSKGLQGRWRNYALDKKNKHDHYPSFESFSDEPRNSASVHNASRAESHTFEPRAPASRSSESCAAESRSYVSRTNEPRTCPKCPICGGAHKVSYCEQFLSYSVDARIDCVKNYKICYNCLAVGHFVHNCKSRFTCQVCHKNHHSLLHISRDHVHDNRVVANGENVTHVLSRRAPGCNSSILPLVCVDVNNVQVSTLISVC